MGELKELLEEYFESDDLYWDVDIDEYISLRRQEYQTDWDQMLYAFENDD